MLKKIIKLSIVPSVVALAAVCCSPKEIDINEGWSFHYDGSPVQTVRLPHDAMIHMERSADVPRGGSVGFYNGGHFIYEKTIKADAKMVASHVTFTFGGVYMNSKVYINDQLAGGIPYGYSEFTVVADGLLKKGDNVIRVESDNSKLQDSRWYSGAGIYRPIVMKVRDPQYIESVHVSTISYSPAKIAVKSSHSIGDVKIEILDKGNVIASATGDDVVIDLPGAQLWSDTNPYLYTVKATLSDRGKTKDVYTSTFGVRKLEWYHDKGLLVNGKETLLKGGCLHADNGILGMASWQDAEYRKVAILKEYGFNAIRSAHQPCSEELLKACDELGMYIMDELWDMWFTPKNANDYGNWFMENYHNDIVAIVEKDFNHPSVIMYSIGNEVGDPVKEGGMEVAHSIIDHLHAIDPSRPTTMGVNLAFLGPRGMRGLMGGGPNTGARRNNPPAPAAPAAPQVKREAEDVSLIFNEAVQASAGKIGEAVLTEEIDEATTPILDALDIAGYNYATARYPIEPQYHPDRMIVGSETYPPDIFTSWKMVEEYPYLVGDFMWTAWDYLGEVGAGAWTYEGEGTGFTKTYPWKFASSGAIDVTGHPTSEIYLAKIAWADDGTPYLGVRPVREDPIVGRSIWRASNSIPSWSWRGREGVPAVIEVYSRADRVSLFLNNNLLESGTPKDGVIMFRIPYTEGTISAKAYKLTASNEYELIGENSLTSATGKLSLSVAPEKQQVEKGHLIYVDVCLVGENGVVDSGSDTLIKVNVEGGELLGFGSARAISEESFDSGEYTSYYGRTQAIIYASSKGQVKITASADGYEDSSAVVTVL